MNFIKLVVFSLLWSTTNLNASQVVFKCTTNGSQLNEIILRFSRDHRWKDSLTAFGDMSEKRAPSFFSTATLTFSGKRSYIGLVQGHLLVDKKLRGKVALSFSAKGSAPHPVLSLMEMPKKKSAFGHGTIGDMTFFVDGCEILRE